jgi:hypothetical protein
MKSRSWKKSHSYENRFFFRCRCEIRYWFCLLLNLQTEYYWCCSNNNLLRNNIFQIHPWTFDSFSNAHFFKRIILHILISIVLLTQKTIIQSVAYLQYYISLKYDELFGIINFIHACIHLRMFNVIDRQQ